MRSGKQQLQDELDAAYKRMTDPEEREKERIRRQRADSIKEQEQDYGL